MQSPFFLSYPDSQVPFVGAEVGTIEGTSVGIPDGAPDGIPEGGRDGRGVDDGCELGRVLG